MSKQFTPKEVRKKFLKQVWKLVQYWNNFPNKTTEERLSGLAFSILAMLDGCSTLDMLNQDFLGLPAFIVVPDPSPDDKKYFINIGENYYPENYFNPVSCNISGSLHEKFYKYK